MNELDIWDNLDTQIRTYLMGAPFQFDAKTLGKILDTQQTYGAPYTLHAVRRSLEHLIKYEIPLWDGKPSPTVQLGLRPLFTEYRC